MTRPTAIAFQGERGAFSEVAARKLLGPDIEVLPCRTFDDVFAAVVAHRAGSAVVPIENSLAGSVFRNYELLAEADLQIAGEVYLRIEHCLVGLPGARLEDIREVHSHPVALAQCQRFLAGRSLEPVAAWDTAGSVKDVVAAGRTEAAAIGSAWAAEIHGGKILAANVEDHHENYTRFLLLNHDGSGVPSDGPRKTTLLFRTPNRPGALFRALAVFALRDINLSKIESRPIEGRPWEYSFYLDLGGDLADPNVARAVDHLREMCETVRILGSYPVG